MNFESFSQSSPVKFLSQLPALVFAVVLPALAGIIWYCHRPETTGSRLAELKPAPTVAVAKVDREDLFQEITIPAEFRPYAEVELHAKVSGYVKSISVDIGDQVKAGQLLATLEIPELQDELNHAQAAQQHAEAEYQNTHLGYTRLVTVNEQHPNLVARQDLDAAQARDAAAKASVAGARADVQKYHAMVDYSHITAPFDGVITRRFADPGALIQAGTSSDPQAKSLVHLSDNYRLRLDFPVSVAYVKDIHLGDTVVVRVESFGGKTFDGVISRFTQQVDEATRTMMTEIEVPNQNLELLPGMYATVVLKAGRRPLALAVPVEAVAGTKNATVMVVNAQNKIEEHPVALGLETPEKYEILSGLHDGDRVIVGNRSKMQPGEKVTPQLVKALSLR